MFLKCTVLLELQCFFSGFLLESVGTLALFCLICDAFSPFSKSADCDMLGIKGFRSGS